jgi:hypothetical protein
MIPRRRTLLTVVGSVLIVLGLLTALIGLLGIRNAIGPIPRLGWQFTLAVCGFLFSGMGLLAVRSARVRTLGLGFILPSLWRNRLRRYRRWFCIRWRICHVCGYDLRASKDRCPECGTAIPAAAAEAALGAASLRSAATKVIAVLSRTLDDGSRCWKFIAWQSPAER